MVAAAPFDLSRHPSARVDVADKMLTRMKQDVADWANEANARKAAEVVGLLREQVRELCADHGGDADRTGRAEADVREGLRNVEELLVRLRHQRADDATMVQESIPLLYRAANFVNVGKAGGGGMVASPGRRRSVAPLSAADESERQEKVRFLLRRACGQEPTLDVTFLFSALLSTRAEEDLLRINPYLPRGTVRFDDLDGRPRVERRAVDVRGHVAPPEIADQRHHLLGRLEARVPVVQVGLGLVAHRHPRAPFAPWSLRART